MRKIDKTQILATAYKQWLDKLTLESKEHPAYTSSNWKFYYDIVANLIWVQQGLCAYTERKLQSHLIFSPESWKKGRFGKCVFAGELDHYDNTLKEKYGWLWGNLFIIDSDVNVKQKRSNTPNGLLKPDLPDFDPFKLLEYDIENHIFVPNNNLDFATQSLVIDDIFKLGLNFDPIREVRRIYLNPFIEKVKYQQQTFDEAKKELFQFFTAFEMSKGYMDV